MESPVERMVEMEKVMEEKEREREVMEERVRKKERVREEQVEALATKVTRLQVIPISLFHPKDLATLASVLH